MSDKEVKALAPGTVVHGPERDYVIIKVLGKGGFGITYLVTSRVNIGNITVDVKFALKEHFISALCDREAESQSVSASGPVSEEVTRSMKSFLREASRLHDLGLSHDNIVKINEVFTANNTAYYVMEFIEGSTLKEYVATHGRLKPEDAVKLLRPLIEAVGMLHQNSVAHYDIKPQNIMLAGNNDTGTLRPVLIDFGLSKHYAEDGSATSTIGSHGYSAGFAPAEQYGGIKKFSPESDVYSLGATLYFCLTGKTPPSAFDIDLEEIRSELMPIAGAALTSAIVKAMEMKPQNRIPNADTLLTAIDAHNDGEASPDTILVATQNDDEATAYVSPNKSAEGKKAAIFTPRMNIAAKPSGGNAKTSSNPPSQPTKKNGNKGLILVFVGLVILIAIIIGVTSGPRATDKETDEYNYAAVPVEDYNDEEAVAVEEVANPYDTTVDPSTRYINFYLEPAIVTESHEFCDYVYNYAIPVLNQCSYEADFVAIFDEIANFVSIVADNTDFNGDEDCETAANTLADVLISTGNRFGYSASDLGLENF